MKVKKLRLRSAWAVSDRAGRALGLVKLDCADSAGARFVASVADGAAVGAFRTKAEAVEALAVGAMPVGGLT